MKKTLPVVSKEQDLEDDTISRRVLPLLASPSNSPPQERQQDNNIASAVSNWLRLNVDDNAYRNRHSIGLDVPGAVHTITTPSNLFFSFESYVAYL
ncbi:hypothetical protein RMATCC62417_15268 [Rhizopus microsporus]|nr:hypothetical protein RMATCC62417_15268 [Rhizopus microsporus]